VLIQWLIYISHVAVAVTSIGYLHDCETAAQEDQQKGYARNGRCVQQEERKHLIMKTEMITMLKISSSSHALDEEV